MLRPSEAPTACGQPQRADGRKWQCVRMRPRASGPIITALSGCAHLKASSAGVLAPDAPTTLSAQALILNPSTRVLWRSPDSVQLELGSRALVIDGIDGATVGDLAGRGLRSGTCTDCQPGLSATLAALTSAGFLWPANERAAAAPPA